MHNEYFDLPRRPLSEWTMSDAGIALLRVMEEPSHYRIRTNDNGQREFMNFHYSGESGVTIGWGVMIGGLNQTQLNRISQYVNGQTSHGQWVTLAEAEPAFQYMIEVKEAHLRWITRNMTLRDITQYEYDALIMQTYVGIWTSMIPIYLDYTGTDSELVQAILERWRIEGGWTTMPGGWTPRVEAQVDVLRNNHYRTSVY